MIGRRLMLCAVAGASLVAGAGSVRADLIGPSAYLSFDDSPFKSLNTGGNNFYLEDFEDGFNSPGVTASSGWIVLGPAGLTDSVDGAVPGSGSTGSSFYSSGQGSLTFTFDDSVLGLFPTHVGIAWTDVGFTSSAPDGFGVVTFEAFDAQGASLGQIISGTLGDGVFAGQNAEDRFFGATFSGGIRSFTISMSNSTDWEVDHLQYGSATVPEPASLILFGIGGGGLWIRRRFRA